jgi:small conductance mechanosensitive channel
VAAVVLACGLPCAVAAEEPVPAMAVTTSDPSIPAEELALLLVPLDKSELLVEAAGWREIVKAKAQEIARAEIAVRRQSKEIARAEEIMEKAGEAKEQLQEVAEKVEAAKSTGEVDKIVEAQEAAAEARASVDEVDASVDATVLAAEKLGEIKSKLGDAAVQSLDETARAAQRAKEAVADIQETMDIGADADPDALKATAARAGQQTTAAQRATDAVQENVQQALADAKAATEQAAALDEAATVLAAAEEAKKAEKIELLERVTQLREQRTLLLDNLRAVVDELENKTDKEDTDTLAKTKDYRRYISTVSGIHVDVTDTTSAWVSLKGWATSHEGGIRWLVNVISFLGILVMAWFLSKLASRVLHKAMSRLALPMLLEEFLVKAVRWVVLIIGVIWALSALEVSIGPLLALVGAAGFILAFAMQDSLSNFASGLMILFFRPFDTGDVVDAGGVSGTVRSMNLVSTTIRTFDNKLMVVPNSKIWSDVITNATGVTQRRVDMEFGIGYSDDIDLAQQILEEIVTTHPKVLKDPAPLVKMSGLGDSSVNFVCRPWAIPANYWDVYWDVTREVKRRFDAAGIGIPYPQRDVHLYIEKSGADGPLKAATGPRHPKAERALSEGAHADGGFDTTGAGV